MKLTIERNALFAGVGHVQSIVDRGHSIAIMKNIAIRASGRGIAISGSDLDMTISAKIPAEIEATGTTTVPAALLFSILRALKSGSKIEIESESGGERLRCGKASFFLPSLPIEDFPEFLTINASHRFDMSAADLAKIIKKTSFAISTEETRYYLNGIYLHEMDGSLLGVSTDSYRLARCRVSLPDGASGMPAVIVARKTIAALDKILAEVSGKIIVGVSSERISVDAGDITLQSKLIDGTYPNYLRIMPSGHSHILDIDTARAMESVKKILVVAEGKCRSLRVSLDSGIAIFSAVGEHNSSVSDELECGWGCGESVFAVNAKYLYEILTCIASGTTRIEVRSIEVSEALQIESADDDSVTYVLMRVRI